MSHEAPKTEPQSRAKSHASRPTSPTARLVQQATHLYHAHSDFILLLLLFITFRVLALAAYRPGGLVLDFSDFYWYRGFAELTRQGYYPYDTLWTTYPPLFPVVMIAIYEFSTLLPPWEFANLWFTLLLGGFFLLFEIGNFILLYLFALQLSPSQQQTAQNPQPAPPRHSQHLHFVPAQMSAIRACWIYATLFVPVYTLTGWFESYPLFFFLLSLYLLLKNRPYLSAFFTGIGFMIKLIPLILMPVAVQLFSKTKYQLSITNYQLSIKKQAASGSSQSAIRNLRQSATPALRAGASVRNPQFTIPFDIPRTAIYTAIFVATVIAIALPFYQMNPDLIFGPQQITGARPPWETVWALIDGNFDYGVIPLDMRNLDWTPGDAPPTRIPWLLVTALFGLIYGWFYTRPFNWSRPRHSLAFVGFTLCLFMLWSKGYSPQWLGWPLFFIALLLPNLRGIIYAVILSIGNIIEANFYFIIFPEEQWLFAATVLIRTLLLAVLAVEFLWLIWPPAPKIKQIRAWGLAGFVALLLAVLAVEFLWLIWPPPAPKIKQIRAWGLAGFVALLLAGSVPAGVVLVDGYFDTRLRQSPYSATINRLQEEPVTGALLLNSHTVYDWFYPYLRQDYQLFMLDDYAPPSSSVEQRTTALLDEIAAQTDVLWIYDADAAATTPAEEALTAWLNNRPPAHIQDIDGGRLYLFILE